MLVLLTNDDGIQAAGIRTLARCLAGQDDIELYVAAPERERSACGHAVTLHRPLRAHELALDNRIAAWSISGTPADCVKLAVGELLPRRPDMVISGINRGANLATDVFYSGTVSGAIEAAIQGVAAVAVSLAAYDNPDFEPAAKYMAELVRSLRGYRFPPFTLLNINIPAVPSDQLGAAVFTKMGIALADDQFQRRLDPNGQPYYWLSARRVAEGWAPDSDVAAIKNKTISVTPLRLDLTDDCYDEVARDCPLPSAPR